MCQMLTRKRLLERTVQQHFTNIFYIRFIASALLWFAVNKSTVVEDGKLSLQLYDSTSLIGYELRGQQIKNEWG